MKKLYFSLLTLFFFFVANAQIVNIPDANFKAKLLSASSSNQVASTQTPDFNGNVTTYNTIDTNSDGEIQVSEAVLIKYLNFEGNGDSITNMEGINNFTNLEYLGCYNNNSLTSINLSGLTNLKYLWCFSNYSLTSLNVSGLNDLENFLCYQNQIISLNLSGLTNLQQVSCQNNQLTSLNVSGLTNLQQLNCGNNQLTSLDVSGLTSLNTISCYNNQLISLDVSGLTGLNVLECSYNQLISLNLGFYLYSLSCHHNQLTSLNLSGMTNLYELYCSHNQLNSLNVSGLTNLQTLVCENNQLNSLNLKNGNYVWGSLHFDSNPNLTYICADDEDVTFVQEQINTLGYTSTCQVNSYCSFTPGGTYYIIQGNNKFDGNANGCDASDGVFPNLNFSITDGTISGILISNTSGNYSIPVSAGIHTFAPQFENPSYFTVSPTSSTVTFPATASPFNQDFCITPNGIHHDLEVVVIPLIPARPGFDATYKIKYKNKGNLNETATLVFNFDDASLDFVSSTLAPTSSSSGSLSWNIGTLIPFQSGEFVVTLNVNSPMETPAVNAGNILIFTAVINGLNTDETPSDNTFSLPQTVVNSFDPNDKTCLEGTNIPISMIGNYVHYRIRFENTGTFPAQNIVVKDMIDNTKFDISSLQMVSASHSCVTRITNPNKVEFIFENINLPFDDNTNDGYVVFKIKTLPTLVEGNTISNLANIYFDYNFPIVTNTATSTFFQPLSNDTFNLDNYLSLSPNPAKDVLNINVQDEANIKSIAIYNMLGQLVQITTNPTNSINISDLKTGNYIIKLHTEKGEISRKFIKE